MDKEGESSSAYTPATPAKGGDRSENMMDKNWLRTPFDEALFEDTSTRKSFSFWEGNLGAPSVNYEMRNTFSVDDVETWHRVPCLDLLALAESSDKSVKLHNFLSDQNAPPLPETVTVTATEAQFTPVTPDQGRKSVNLEEQPIVEANEKGLAEKVEINLNEKPEQPKQKRRKHRPKVVRERKPRTPKTPKTPQTPKPEGGSSTGKRKYVRKKAVEKTPEDQINKSCKRRIDFDEVKEKTQVETCPITPDKTELSKETLKTGGEKAKCRIDFSEGTREKRVSVYPNESSCSTVQPWDKNAQVCEAYLSMFTDYSSGSKHEALLSAIYKRRKIEKHQTSITSTTVSSGESCKYKKKTKSLAVVHETVSCAGKHEQHMRMEMEATKKWGKKGRKNIGCILNDIDAIIKKFEQLNLAEKDRVAIVPFSSKNREIYANENKNAMVLYQGHGGLVPYDGVFNPIKRRKPRPKVDLDDETSRVWRLLLEDINSQGIDGTDEDKAKWWEEERRVFRGRADSFIARMHLVQGDRRFSRWKGSVLDSVIGVFLTQNVSDHLSSSAFMSLASRYPLKTKSEPSPSQVNEEQEEEETMMLNNTESCEVSKNSAYTVDLNDNLECEEVPEPSEKDLIISEVEDIITSSQNSENTSPSSVQSSSVVNTTEEEQKESSKSTPFLGGHTSFVELLHMQGTTKVQEECRSEESGLSVESATQVTVQMVKSNSSDGDRCQIVTEGEKVKSGKKRVNKVEWDRLRLEAEVKEKREKTPITMDSLDYEAVMNADVNEIADAIKERGMNNVLAARIKDLLDRLVKDHGSIDLEWLRDVPPDKAKEYLLSFRGLGLKSVECVRLLTLHHLAFPVDTNVGRIAVRLGWVPLQPLPESLQLHLLELYPVLESIQKYLWPRLCKLDQRTLYELHYQMITFGKVFCTKSKPNCNACPMRGECRHFASAFASARLGLPAPEEGLATLTENKPAQKLLGMAEDHHQQILPPATEQLQQLSEIQNCNPVIEEPATPSGPIIEVPATPAGPIVEVPASPEPIVEVPATPEPEQIEEIDMEDFGEDSEEIPMIKLNMEEFTQNLQTYMEKHMELGECDMSKALVALTSEAAAIPTPKLKNVSQLRTEHQVYELPDTHPLLQGLDTREPDDPCSYLLAIWTPGETADSIQPPAGQCSSQESGTLCNEETCFFCNSTREANSQTVRGTLLIPCRTAMRGSFPLNGTYFQVNEVFADHDSSLNPIDVPRSWLWNLPRRTVYFGTSIPTIFKGLTTEDIQYCFWRGFVCVRGFDQKTRAPRPLMARLHFPASKIKRTKTKTDDAN